MNRVILKYCTEEAGKEAFACARTPRLRLRLRVVNIWNSLPDYVVAVDCVNIFKTKLDKYWKDQDFMYDWTSEITGTGDRSEYILKST